MIISEPLHSCRPQVPLNLSCSWNSLIRSLTLRFRGAQHFVCFQAFGEVLTLAFLASPADQEVL